VTHARDDPAIASPLDDLERQAVAAYLAGAEEASEDLWTLAHNASLRGKDLSRAARCVFWLVLDLFNRGEWARGNGWLARGLHVLEAEPDSAALGLLLAVSSRHHLKQGDTEAAARAAARAVDLAGQFDDPELSVFSRLGLALVQVRRRQLAEAAALLDEMMVAVTVDNVSPIAVGVAYCAVIDACNTLFDLSRAREWTLALDRWCSTQSNPVAFRGKCLVHRSEIMRLSGAWTEALAEAEQACAWSDAHPKSFKYPAGAALYELGEIHRLRGNLARAEAAYRRASEHGQVPEPGLTLLRFGEGKEDIAAAAISRLLKERQSGPRRAAVLHAAVEILTSSGDLTTARTAADELEEIATQYYAPAMRALAAHATGAVLLREGDVQKSLNRLREAWTAWQELAIPYEAARVRVLLGQACLQLGDRAAAELEFDTARLVFVRLSAEPDIVRVDALRQRSPRSGVSALTARELQVIGLVATGETNRAIAQRLSISERTVDRHVSNILLKLDLPSRSAATAYALRHQLI
jgi:DNA-binding CsgD family transcriptional regulator